MKLPYKNPEKLLDKLIDDLNIKLNAKQRKKLKEDLSDIYCARLYFMMNALAGDQELPLDDRTQFLNFVMFMPEIEDELKFETDLFYEDMIQTYNLTKAINKN